MLKWVREGLDYHQGHDLSSCLFCGNELTEGRRHALAEAIDDGFTRLTGAIADARQNAERLRDRLAGLKGALPSVNDISKEIQTRFAAPAGALQACVARGMEIVSTILSLLTQKAVAPNVRVDGGDLTTEADAAEWDTALAHQVSEINAAIEAHNRSHDMFSQVQEEARTKLKGHFLVDGQARYRELEAEIASAKTEVADLEVQERDLESAAERLRQDMRQHGPAADMINRLVGGYLGHKDLQIGTLESGYQIRRNGRPVTGSLSEGEKTAIALCYFLCTLEAEERQAKNLIVVVDDPISSLDTRALNYAFSIIRARLAEAGQLVIMAHNLHFMNEAKKWLKKGTEKEAGEDKATAALFFLDAVQDVDTGFRSSALKIMPKLIREYESEYHYLFHLLLEFASPDGKTEYFYLMPNALRKVLEIFLAFKLPGSEGLASKVENVANAELGLDPARIRALDRLVQIESHADNLDDLVTFSSMTIEETKDAAAALLVLSKRSTWATTIVFAVSVARNTVSSSMLTRSSRWSYSPSRRTKHRIVRAGAQHRERSVCGGEGGVDMVLRGVLPGTSGEILRCRQAATAFRVAAFYDAGEEPGAHRCATIVGSRLVMLGVQHVPLIAKNPAERRELSVEHPPLEIVPGAEIL